MVMSIAPASSLEMLNRCATPSRLMKNVSLGY